MRSPFKHTNHPDHPDHHGKPYHMPLLYRILIFIGFLTVIYLLITYAVIPLLALMTVS